MPVKVFCSNPACDASYSVTPESLGRTARCKKGGQRFTLDESSKPTRAGSRPGEAWLPLPDTADEGGLPEQFGRYRIIRNLGQGGMGAVYLAHDTELDRPVALKIPHASSGDQAETLSRFRREARAAA